MSALLIGYRGSGKSSIGRKLADRLWQGFVDVDEQIVARAGKSIAEIFAQDGEPAFRDLETAVLGDVLQRADHVIALGGGTPVRAENRRMIQASGHRVIYLRCEPGELLRRVSSDPATTATRPSLTALGGGLAEIQTVLAEREPLYRQIAHAEVDVTHLAPEVAVVYIVRLL